MKIFAKYLKPNAKFAVFGCMFEVVATLCNLALPLLMSQIVDDGINKLDFDYVWKSVLLMFSVAAVGMVCHIMAIKQNLKATTRFTELLKNDVFEKANKMTFSDHNRLGAAGLLTRTETDVWQMSEVTDVILSGVCTIPIYMICGSVLAFMKDAYLALLLFAFTPVIIAAVILVGRKIHPLWEIADKQTDRQNQLVRERLIGIRVIRAFNRDETECQKTNEATRKMVLNYIKSNNRSGLIAPVAMLVLNVATLLIVYVGATRMQSGTGLSAADVVAVVQYVGLIMSGIMTLSWSLIFVPRVRVNVKRLSEILESESIPDATDLDKPALNGNVLFDNVSFAYADGSELVLSGVSFEVKAGEKVAIIGGTGSGKSTLVSLLLGFNKPTSGTLAFDGENVEGISGERLRTNVSAVLQKGTIFAGTLRENIGLWQDFTDEQIMEAVRDAQLESFVSSHPEGLDFKLSQGGSNVSGGQKQRIQIARALLKKAAIFLFDDSFSALDFMTESKIRTAIKDKLAPRTVFVVTQRVTGAMNSDKIIVMDNGKVVGIGKHEELLQNCSVYNEIFISQSGRSFL